MFDMRRREFITLLGGAGAAWPPPLSAQQAAMKAPRIAVLAEGGREEVFSSLMVAFRQGLLELGYVEGQNVSVEYRWGDGTNDRLRSNAAELVALNVDIIVAAGGAQPVLSSNS